MAANRLVRSLAFGAVLLAAAGCPVYNQECSPIVTDPDEVTGWLGGDVQTVKSVVRTRDNPFGQLVAEAYYHAFDSSSASLRPDVGMQNAGSIRSEGVCVSREVVKKGPVRRSVLREVMPFDNGVVVLKVSHEQLRSVLEHALAGLSPSGSTSPPGAFMQLYGLTVEANCNNPAQTLKADGTLDHEGSRVTSITLNKRDGTTEAIPLSPAPSKELTLRLATNSYVGGGGDNFAALKGVDSTEAGGNDFEIIAAYFKKTYTELASLSATPAERWILTDCH
ncbi:MAG TPA: 5'-nucleotidase [Myxococcales bacterium]|jgi:2',3'-cyclic-nucleotide 2'-phosphodiesterase (5'-nucleotidase family)